MQIVLAGVLGVKTVRLWCEPEIKIELIAYRMLARLGKNEQARIEALVAKNLEERCFIQEKLGIEPDFKWMSLKKQVNNPFEAEMIANDLRKNWSLGKDSINDLIAVLEDRLVHVFELESDREFDGISSIAKSGNDKVVACAVTTRKAVAGDRQRMNLAHELGHIMIEPSINCNPEEAAFRFAGAFLIPEATLKREIGSKRVNIQLAELITLKRRFKVSIQAILKRMKDLEIITETSFKWWQIAISKQGWRKQEPEQIMPEKPDWMQRMTIRALAEGLITQQEIENMGCLIPEGITQPTPNRSAFLRLPMEQRRKILHIQAEQTRKTL